MSFRRLTIDLTRTKAAKEALASAKSKARLARTNLTRAYHYVNRARQDLTRASTLQKAATVNYGDVAKEGSSQIAQAHVDDHRDRALLHSIRMMVCELQQNGTRCKVG